MVKVEYEELKQNSTEVDQSTIDGQALELVVAAACMHLHTDMSTFILRIERVSAQFRRV